jgi:MFS family permease
MSDSTRRWSTVVLVCLGTFISYIDRGNLAIAAPALSKDLGLPPERMGLLLSAFFWSYAAFQIPAGYVVDRFGIKVAFFVALALWSVASAAVGMASSFAAVFALRLALGVCESIGPVASIAFIKGSFREEEQGTPTSIYTSGAVLGPALGTWAGSAIIEAVGWRQLFILTGLAGLVWLVPWGAVASSPKTRAQQAAPFSYPVALSHPLFWAIAAGAFFYSYYWYFILTWAPTYLVEAHGMSFRKMGFTLGLPLAVTVATNLAGGWLADRVIARGHPPLTVRKWFIATGFVLATTMLALPHTPRDWVLALFVVSMAGMGFAVSNYWAVTHIISPPQWIGRVIGFQNFIAQTAGITAPIATGYLLGPSKDFGTAILFAGFAPLVGLAAIYWGITAASIGSWRARAGAASS